MPRRVGRPKGEDSTGTHGTEAAISPNKPLPRTDASSVLAFDPGISAVKSLLTPSRYAGIQASATGSSSFGKLLPIVWR